MEIQDDVDKIIKKEIKPPSPLPPYTPPPELMVFLYENNTGI